MENTKFKRRSSIDFRKFLNINWWENQVKYNPFFQRLFLLFSLSNKFPATLNIEPTNFCNLSCIFCPVKNTNREKGYIDLALYQKIINEMTSSPPVPAYRQDREERGFLGGSSVFSCPALRRGAKISKEKKLKVLWLNKDGEPLLHQEIAEMVEYAKKKQVADRIEIYTNGILLTIELSEKLIKAGLDSLVVSLDANNKDSFKKIKKRDGYQTVVNNIHNFLKARDTLKAKKPLLSVKMVDLGNKEETRKFIKQWEKVADCVIIQSLHKWEGSAVKISNFELLALSKFSCEKRTSNLKRYPCNLPWLSPAVNWDGTIVPCCVNYKKNELIMGDLKKQSLKEIWQGEEFKKLRKAHLSQDFSRFPTCKNCSYWQQLPNMR